MLSCIYLLIFVNFPPPMPDDQVQHEWHYHQFCEPGVDLWDKPAIDNPGLAPGACEVAANQYLELLQMAGILPGSTEVVQYKASCTTTL